MRTLIATLLGAASACALASTAAAQAAGSQEEISAADHSVLGEIVVTARRQSESLQQVPQTVNAITSDTLQKLNIRQFQDIQAIVPGMSLQKSFASNGASLRGVEYQQRTTAAPTVAFYLNDAPVQANQLFQGMFDVGQVEVLKGPQGTTRGIAAPSGAITLTTRRPNLSEYGGFVDATATDLQGRNLQAAVNVPIIQDVLGVRIAGLVDQNDADGVRSLNSRLRPRAVTTGERISVSFQPGELFDGDVVWQHLDTNYQAFTQVSGAGQGVINAPPLTPTMRVGVADGPNGAKGHFDVVIANLNSRIFGQHLNYVGSYQSVRVNQKTTLGPGNILPGIELYQDTASDNEQTTHEFRVSSDPSPDRFFDYVVGAYYQYVKSATRSRQPSALTPGAFGNPAAGVDLAAFNPAYQIPLDIVRPGQMTQETSLFGNLTLHLGSKTELSGGLRHIWLVDKGDFRFVTGDGLAARPPSAVGAASCAAAGLPSTYPGFCDVPQPGGRVVGQSITRSSETTTIYNISLSHRITRDFLVYANTGTSYRPGPTSIGLQGAIVSSSIPDIQELTFHPSEKSTSYEIGFKSSWLDNRARLNVAIYRQKFDNFIMLVPGIAYLNTVTGQPLVADLTTSVDATVRGFDVDTAFQVNPNWNISAQLSYADGKANGQVPCNITGPAGAPVFNTGGLVSFCPGGPASRQPLWNASIQTEYVHHVNDDMDGFVRGLFTYYPESRNRAEPNFTVDNYSLLNVYAGVRAADGAWEASLFARNAFKTDETLDVQTTQVSPPGALASSFGSLIRPTGYYQSAATPRREVGVNVRYAFGSR